MFASRIHSVCAIFEMELHGHLELAFWICRDPGSCISPCIQRIKLRTQLHEMKIFIESATVHRTQRTANHIRSSGVLMRCRVLPNFQVVVTESLFF